MKLYKTLSPSILASRQRPTVSIIAVRSSLRTLTQQTIASMAEREYLVVIPDHPNAEDKRARAQPDHIKEATPLIESGRISYFGVTYDRYAETSTSTDNPTINGSVIVFRGEGETSIREALRRDPYTKGGVWNVEKAQIWPFKSG